MRRGFAGQQEGAEYEQCAAGDLSGSRDRDTEINRHDGEDVGLFDALLTSSDFQAAFVDEPGPHGH